MKKLLKFLVLVAIITLIVLNIGKINTYADRWINFSFCDEPVLYKIGTIDDRFGVTKEQVVNDTLRASELWNEILDKDLFKLDPNADLTISLVYDERQENLSTISQQKSLIEEEKENISGDASTFEAKKIIIESELKNLNSEIESWNTKGGAPKKVYDELVRKQKNLQEEINQLNSMAEKLNQTTGKVNDQISQLNSSVNKFNDLLTTKPEEGLYMGSQNKIEIYIYDNNESFVHTVAHELGHALGLGHVEEVNSILYPISSPDSHATESDISALKTYCSEQNRLELIKNDLKNSIMMLFSQLQNVVT